MQLQHNKCRHGDAYYIAPSASFRRRACCKRYVVIEYEETNIERVFSIVGYWRVVLFSACSFAI